MLGVYVDCMCVAVVCLFFFVMLCVVCDVFVLTLQAWSLCFCDKFVYVFVLGVRCSAD